MPYTTLVAGTTITASWANASVRDQVVTPHASSAARTSAVTAPVEGMLHYLSDSDRFDGYTGSAWLPAAWLPPFLFVRRSGDAGSTISTTLADDDTLLFTVAANAVYVVQAYITYTSPTDGDLKVGWSGPTSATFDWNVGGPASDQNTTVGTPFNGAQTISGSDIAGGNGTSSQTVARPSGVLVTSSTSGSFKFRWSAGSSSVSGTQVRAASWLLALRVA